MCASDCVSATSVRQKDAIEHTGTHKHKAQRNRITALSLSGLAVIESTLLLIERLKQCLFCRIRPIGSDLMRVVRQPNSVAGTISCLCRCRCLSCVRMVTVASASMRANCPIACEEVAAAEDEPVSRGNLAPDFR